MMIMQEIGHIEPKIATCLLQVACGLRDKVLPLRAEGTGWNKHTNCIADVVPSKVVEALVHQ